MATGKKTGGRTKGTPNKLTRELREELKHVMHGEIEMLPDRLKELDNDKRIDAVIKLMQFVLPKLDTINAKDGEAIEWNADVY